jgi:hypothetical protein
MRPSRLLPLIALLSANSEGIRFNREGQYGAFTPLPSPRP